MGFHRIPLILLWSLSLSCPLSIAFPIEDLGSGDKATFGTPVAREVRFFSPNPCNESLKLLAQDGSLLEISFFSSSWSPKLPSLQSRLIIFSGKEESLPGKLPTLEAFAKYFNSDLEPVDVVLSRDQGGVLFPVLLPKINLTQDEAALRLVNTTSETILLQLADNPKVVILEAFEAITVKRSSGLLSISAEYGRGRFSQDIRTINLMAGESSTLILSPSPQQRSRRLREFHLMD